MSSVTPCRLQEWQAPNIGIPNDVSETGRSTYYSASTFLLLPTFWNDCSLGFLFLFYSNHFPSLPVAPSSTIFSKVAGDFLIARSKAIFYFSSGYHVTRISLFSELFPYRFVLLHFWWHSLCSLWWLFFLLSYHREPRDSIFGLLFFYLYSLFLFPPLNHAPFKLLCVCQRWHHPLNHSDQRVWSYLWLCFPFLIQPVLTSRQLFLQNNPQVLSYIVNWYNLFARHWDTVY